ncbi:MAG: histidine kinase N-terminal 7TM domain-containing protein [Anaerolineales bacterium]
MTLKTLVLDTLQTLNQLLTAGISITAFSLLLYALSFNLRDKIARSFAFIMTCVVVVFVGESVASVMETPQAMETWLRFQWIGLAYLPSAYLQMSDAVLATTGRPSRGRRTKIVKATYLISTGFLVALPFSLLVGPLVTENVVSPYLKRTWLTLVFTFYYLASMIFTWINFARAYNRTVTRASRRRMGYLIGGALAPALGSYPYLLFGATFATAHPVIFWLLALFNNVLVSGLIIIMAYAVAFFGVPWPDRVVKRRLIKWVMRGPVTASTVLAVVTIARRVGGVFATFSPVIMAGSLLLMQYMITMLAPVWERWFLYDGEEHNLELIQHLEERLLTRDDLRQFLESVIAAVCDRLQVENGFVASLDIGGLDLLVTVGHSAEFEKQDFSDQILEFVNNQGDRDSFHIFSWGEYWLIPMFKEDGSENLLGILGVEQPEGALLEDQRQALEILVDRASGALEDSYLQRQVFTSLEDLTPQMGRLQRLRAAALYDGTNVLISPEGELELDEGKVTEWVGEALSDYWGGPDLSESPLLQLKVVQRALDEHEGISVKAVRSILREAIDKIKPEGERRFTLDWVLYNILEMKFLRGQKVRDVARRLAMSEANLYRKQKVAIEVVAKTIIEMEQQAQREAEGESEA